MTPKQKAEELINSFIGLNSKKMSDDSRIEHPTAKQCALIAVYEILDLNLGLSNCDDNNWKVEKFYEEVKKEIENL